ncbi:hypothetical protein [Halobiforma nitratireducens]|uniref:Uncharacterized protein n=1 Tax=Halobiforma nitratireducens JCM 10879 TaxID=1227454 RepID=M0LBZ6_9EURY|nr:hypothetical protein [Halobiforma nitratireducens]EMA31077.1 hypothetical protein C446_16095 [Halobiforma nitratireducens JCM 10879]
MIAIVGIGVVFVAGVMLDGGVVFVVDALFVLAIGCFALAVLLTRPSVSRRRAIDDATDEHESTGQDGRSGARDPAVQFRTGIRLALVATAFLAVSFGLDYTVV